MAGLIQNRELDPRLFGTGPAAETPDPALRPGSPPASSAYLPLELKALEAQVQSARAQGAAVEQNLVKFGAHVQELVRSVDGRLERFGASLKRLEASQAQQFQDLSGKHAVLAGKVNERKVNDDKILDLIERHNIIVRNFENRLVTLGRTLSEQELQLHASNAALDEARQDLARMKCR